MVNTVDIYKKILNADKLSIEDQVELCNEFDLGTPDMWRVVEVNGDNFLMLKKHISDEKIIRIPGLVEMIKNLI